MAKQTVPGYVFPNIPERWTQDERNFAFALHNLFDTLFIRTRGLESNFDKDSYNSLKDRPLIAGVLLTGNRSLSDFGIVVADEDDTGLMTAAMYRKLAGVEASATYTRPEVDYLSMMQGIDIPTDTSNKVTKLSGYYSEGSWNKLMIWDAVSKEWITDDDYEDITGEPFPPFRPD